MQAELPVEKGIPSTGSAVLVSSPVRRVRRSILSSVIIKLRGGTGGTVDSTAVAPIVRRRSTSIGTDRATLSPGQAPDVSSSESISARSYQQRNQNNTVGSIALSPAVMRTGTASAPNLLFDADFNREISIQQKDEEDSKLEKQFLNSETLYRLEIFAASSVVVVIGWFTNGFYGVISAIAVCIMAIVIAFVPLSEDF